MSPKAVNRWVIHFGRTFWLTWMVKGSVSAVPRLAKLLKKAEYQQIINVVTNSYGRATMRTASTIASFFALFSGLERLQDSIPEGVPFGETFISAAMASLIFQMETEEERWSWAQYLTARAGVAALKANIPRAYHSLTDYTLWVVSMGQLMYSFIHYPNILEAGYRSYLKHTSMGNTESLAKMQLVGLQNESDCHLCTAIHEGESCALRIARMAWHNFKMAFPVYLVLYTVPSLLLTRRYHLLSLSHNLIV